MSSADGYRQNASRCLDMAHHARPDADRAMWLKMAEKWLGMARRAEEREDGMNQIEGYPVGKRLTKAG